MTDKAQAKSGTAQPAKPGCCQNEAVAKPSAGAKTAKPQEKTSTDTGSSCCCGTKHEKSAA